MTVATADYYPGAIGSIIRAGVPTENVNKPFRLKLYDWSDYTAPVLVSSMLMNNPVADLEFEDSRLQDDIGTVAVTQSTQSMVWAGFEFGATMFEIDASRNDESTEDPVFELLVACSPYGRWPTFPAYDTYQILTDSTIPPPFKIIVENAVGNVLHTYELHDGQAINDTRSSHQVRTDTLPLRPWFNCGMMLPWQSARLKIPTHLNFWHPGITDDSKHPGDAHVHYSVNAAIPLLAERFQINSQLHWYAAPRWPIQYDNVFGGTTETNALDPNTGDSYLWPNTIYTGDDATAKAWRSSGWDYEPGSISCHDWYPGPGGQRFDRSFVPSVIALYATNTSGVRAKNNEPLRDMTEAWSKAYFNHPFHYVRNPKTFEMIPNSQIVSRSWSYGGAYYGTGFNYVPGGDTRHVATFGIPNADTWPANSPDKDGKRQFNGAQYDDQHNYSAPGWGVLALGSPMHVYSQKHRFVSNTMSWLGDGITSVLNFFGRRQHAWKWLQYAMTWNVGTTHSLGFSRAEIETMLQAELEAIHDQIYVPAVIENSTNFSLRTLRDLGCWSDGGVSGSGSTAFIPVPTPLGIYMVGPMFMMKQSGMLDVMRGKNSKCDLAISFLIECLDKYCVDMMNATNGRAEFGDSPGGPAGNKMSTVGTVRTMPTSWANWATLHPATGSESWVRNSAGVLTEWYAAQNLRAQWCYMRRDYMADENPSRLSGIEAACDLFDGFYAEWRAGGKTWNYRIPAHGILKAA